jgi:hypothetical protein
MPDITELLALTDAPDPDLWSAVQRHGGRRTIDAVFDHAVDVQYRDPDAAIRGVLLIDRIRGLLCSAHLDRLSRAKDK